MCGISDQIWRDTPLKITMSAETGPFQKEKIVFPPLFSGDLFINNQIYTAEN